MAGVLTKGQSEIDRFMPNPEMARQNDQQQFTLDRDTLQEEARMREEERGFIRDNKTARRANRRGVANALTQTEADIEKARVKTADDATAAKKQAGVNATSAKKLNQ
mgnify:CR=1 FL=1